MSTNFKLGSANFTKAVHLTLLGSSIVENLVGDEFPDLDGEFSRFLEGDKPVLFLRGDGTLLNLELTVLFIAES